MPVLAFLCFCLCKKENTLLQLDGTLEEEEEEEWVLVVVVVVVVVLSTIVKNWKKYFKYKQTVVHLAGGINKQMESNRMVRCVEILVVTVTDNHREAW